VRRLGRKRRRWIAKIDLLTSPRPDWIHKMQRIFRPIVEKRRSVSVGRPGRIALCDRGRRVKFRCRPFPSTVEFLRVPQHRRALRSGNSSILNLVADFNPCARVAANPLRLNIHMVRLLVSVQTVNSAECRRQEHRPRMTDFKIEPLFSRTCFTFWIWLS